MRPLLAGCLLTLLAGAGWAREVPDLVMPEPPAEWLPLPRAEFAFTHDACGAEAPGCFQRGYGWPVMEEAGDAALVATFLLGDSADEGPILDVLARQARQEAGDFSIEAAATRAEFGELPPGFVNRLGSDVRVHCRTPAHLALSVGTYFDGGGAHGLPGIGLSLLRRADGTAVTLNDLGGPNVQADLTARALPSLRASVGLEPEADLETSGVLFVSEDSFELTDNFTATLDGLMWIFNPYEIAPYSTGMPMVLLRWDELGGLIDPGLLEDLKGCADAL